METACVECEVTWANADRELSQCWVCQRFGVLHSQPAYLPDGASFRVADVDTIVEPDPVNDPELDDELDPVPLFNPATGGAYWWHRGRVQYRGWVQSRPVEITPTNA